MSFEAQIIEAIEGGARNRNALGAAFRQMHPDALAKKLYALLRDGHVAYVGAQLCVRKQLSPAPAADASAAGRTPSPPSQEGGASATVAPVPPQRPVTIVIDNSAPGQIESLLPATRQAINEPRETAMAKTKTCNECDKEKPLSEFYGGNAKCKPCYNARQKARKEAQASGGKVAAPPPVAKKRGKPVRKVRANAKATRPRRVTRAPKPARQNGTTEDGFVIPAGREIRGNVINVGERLSVLELTAAEPGKEPDQRLHLSRDQCVVLRCLLEKLVAE